MNEQERKIIKLLLNEMAFEGALKHFNVPPPDLPEALYDEIVAIEIPKKYDGNTESYIYAQPNLPAEMSAYEKCYKYLRLIRNNIIHANKAYRPDTPDRLTELLDWAEKFIEAVYETDSDFAQCAREIKATMQIEEF